MSNTVVFSFENASVRTIGSSESPLFVAIDVAKALGYSQPAKSVNDRVDAEDLVKAEIDTKGGKQTVNCVNESGLYALIFGSKLPSAKRFKRWVTTEVLPAIRKSGKYECPMKPDLQLTEAQAHTIMSEVAKRAKNVGAHYQTIYRALKARYQVTKYTHILQKDFDDAVRFIREVDLRVPEAVPFEPEPDPVFDETGRCRYCGLKKIPEGWGVLSPREMERLMTWVYYWRYLFREPLHLLAQFLTKMHSPYSAKFNEAVADPWMGFLEDILRRQGYDLRNMKCYQYFMKYEGNKQH